jgi:ketosteroid isomerase-like protein
MKFQHKAMIAALLASGSLVACDKAAAPAAAVDKAKITEAVKADANGLITAFNARDADKAVSHDAPGMVGMFHGTPNVVGAEEDLKMTKQQFAENSVANIKLSDETVDVADSGDMAIYRASYAFTGQDPKTKKAISEGGNWVVGYAKQSDGSWKIAWNVVSDAKPAAAGASKIAVSDAKPASGAEGGADKKAAAEKVEKGPIQGAIKKDIADLVEALNNKNIEKAVTHDTPDSVGMFHGQPNTVGPEQDLKATKAVFVDPLAWVQVGKETVDVSDAGDMAVYRTTYNFRSTDPKTKKEAHEHGNWIVGYKKQANDTWKIAWSVISDTPAETDAAAPAAKK